MKRKGITAMQVIVTAVILIVVAVVVLFIFRTYIGKQAGIVGEQISSLGDCDGDGVRNFMDKCPCDNAGPNPSDKYTGCPLGMEPNKCEPGECKEKNAEE